VLVLASMRQLALHPSRADRLDTVHHQMGGDASGDMIRNSARCSQCGHKGTTLQHPPWVGLDVGFAPWPIEPQRPTPAVGG